MSVSPFFTLGAVALIGSVSAFAAPAVYTFADGAQGWTAAEGVGLDNFGSEAGAITFDYVTPTAVFDPILQSPTGLTVNAATDHWLRVDVELTTVDPAPDQLFQIFYNDGSPFNEGDSRTFTVTPNAGIQTIVLNMATIQPTRTDYSGTVTAFRLDPGTSQADLVGGSGRIELIALTDDADMDNLVDDVEIAIFGDITTSDGDTDTDGDGISDGVEIALGLDPLTDEGASVPTGGAAATLVGLGLLGAWSARQLLKRSA